MNKYFAINHLIAFILDHIALPDFRAGYFIKLLDF